jgi:hypothetical protein
VGKAPVIVKYPILFFFLAAIIFQSCSRSTCSEAMDATQAAQYGFDAAIDEVMHGGASLEALDKEHRAYVKLDKAKDEERQACQEKTSY